MALTPLAVENIDLLRALQAGGHASPGALAEAVDRDKSNIARTLKRLHGAGLIAEATHQAALTAEALQVLAAADAAEGKPPPAASAQMPQGFALLPLRQVFNDPLNPRKHFDEEAIAELAESIAVDGLLENLVVRRDPAGSDIAATEADGGDARVPIYRIVAGERRWRALNLLATHDRWDRHAAAVPCKIIDIDDATHRRIALVENLQRKDLRPIDEAQALSELMKVTGQGTAEVAEQIGFTQRFVQQRLQLLDLPDTVQTKVNAGDVSIEKARQIASILPSLPAAKAKDLVAGKITPDDAKRWLDNQPKLRDDLTPRQWLIMLELADHSARTAGGLWTDAMVGVGIEEDPDWKGLRATWGYPVFGPNPVWDNGFDTGRRRAHVYSYGGSDQLKLKFGADVEKEAARQAYLAQARTAAGVEFPLAYEPGQYATPWLNGPFDIAPEIQAQIDKAKADRAVAEARQAEAEEEAARRKGEAFNVAQSILVQHRKRELPALDTRYADALAAFDVALPVRVAPNGDVQDANGRQLVHGGYYNGAPPAVMARNTLLALAVNAAAGLHTPDHPKPAADPDAIPRKDFVWMVAGILLEDIDDLDETEAQLMAERGLTAYLAAESIEYGDPAHDWEEIGAMAIAQGIREHGLGQAADAAEVDALEAEDA